MPTFPVESESVLAMNDDTSFWTMLYNHRISDDVLLPVVIRTIPTREDVRQAGVEGWGRGECCYKSSSLWNLSPSPPGRLRSRRAWRVGDGESFLPASALFPDVDSHAL